MEWLNNIKMFIETHHLFFSSASGLVVGGVIVWLVSTSHYKRMTRDLLRYTKISIITLLLKDEFEKQKDK